MTAISWIAKHPIAHRGLHDLNKACWENTLSAFEAAVRAGYAIECDVHLSSDGVPMVFHDDHLMRLTGSPGTVHDLPAAELVQLRVGGTDDRIPTLAEMLEAVGGRSPLVIELKGTPGRDSGLVAKVAESLRGYAGQSAIMSFDHWLVRDFATQAPGIPGGLTATGTSADDLRQHFAALAYGISFVSFDVTQIPNPFVSHVRQKLEMPVITWTVRNEEGVRRTQAHADQMTFEGFRPKPIIS